MRTCDATVGPLHLGRRADAKHIMNSSHIGAGRGGIESMLETWRRALRERRVRATLADMDERLLADIGIALDEVARVRARERFTPRAWLMRRRRAA